MIYLLIACIFVCLIGVAACGIATDYLSAQIVDQLNQELPMDERFSEALWYFGKTNRLLSEHVRLFPESALRRRRRSLILAAAFCIATAGFVLVVL